MNQKAFHRLLGLPNSQAINIIYKDHPKILQMRPTYNLRLTVKPVIDYAISQTASKRGLR